MSPEQQRAIDALIVAGKLDAAAELYRTATGTALIGAKMYVYDRATVLKASAPATPPPPRPPGIVDPRRTPPAANATPKKKGCVPNLFTTIVILIALFNFGKHAIETRGFGLFTIVHKPYYRELVRAIEHERSFRAKIGAPIVSSDADVFCSQVSSDSDGSDSSDCNIPVHAPRAPAEDGAYVRARTAIDPHAFRAELWLHAANRAYYAIYRRRK